MQPNKYKKINLTSAIYWGKYNVTRDMYPPLHRYPQYCNGQCTMMNQKALDQIANQTRNTALNNFRIEDLFYTGILREKAKISNLVDFDRTPVMYDELRVGKTKN